MSTSVIVAAAVQCDPQVGMENKDKNLARTLELANAAADEGANLVVLPELVNTGYSFETREEAYAHAEPLTGPTVHAWCELAPFTWSVAWPRRTVCGCTTPPC